MVLIYPHNLFIFSALSLSMPMSSNSPSHFVSVLPQVISQLKNQYFVMFLFIAEASDIEFDVPTATTTTPSESGRSRRRRLARGCWVLGSDFNILWAVLVSRWAIARVDGQGGDVRLDRYHGTFPHSLLLLVQLVLLPSTSTFHSGRPFVLFRKVFYFPSANSYSDSSSNRFSPSFSFSFLHAPIGIAGSSAESTAWGDLQKMYK